MNNMDKLVSIGGKPLSSDEPDLAILQNGSRVEELKYILASKNGFFAFNSGLNFYPIATNSSEGPDFSSWNSNDLWRKAYAINIPDEMIFFGQDIFGVQFCLADEQVMTFDPETGQLDYVASSLDEFCGKLLDEHDVLVGSGIAFEWQNQNRKLASNERLMPITPFVLGGEFDIKNLRAVDSVDSMHFRAEIANQIKELPDGQKIQFEVGD